jgi:uncharacterized delta-60 repeat protein
MFRALLAGVATGLMLAAAGLIAVVPAHARPGELDPTFGSGGVVTIPGRDASLRADAVAVQADGRVVVAGDDGNSFLATRLRRSGARDRGFGVRGGLAVRFAGSTSARAREVGLFRDGRILLAGTVEIAGVRRFGVARLLPGGDLDPSFGTDGVAIVGPPGAELEGMALARDGELVLAGSVERPGQRPAALVMRLLPDADPDPGFGAAGVADLGFAGRARDVLVLADGAVAVALAGERLLTGPGTFFAARLTAAGALDPAFGAGGIATVTTTRSALRGGGAAAIAPGPGGRLVLAGTARGGGRRYDATLVRLDPGGTPDPRFGRAGVARLRAPGSRSVRVEDMARDRSGRLVLGGRAGPPSSAVMRVRANGRRDWLFTRPLGGVPAKRSYTEVRGVAVERDGDIVTAGTVREGPRTSLVVARLRGR